MLPAMDNAQLKLSHESIGISPFLLTRGYSPGKSFDWQAPKKPTNAKEKLSIDDAIAFAKRIEDGWKIAQLTTERAQEKMTRHANRHRRREDWGVGDMVYLSTKNLSLGRPSSKLAAKYCGPFKVLEQVGNSWKLDTPTSWRNQNVFHSRYLRKDANDPLPGEIVPPPEAINIGGDGEYEVDYVEAARLVNKKLKYRIKFLGTDPDPEWYPASNLMGAPHKLREFHLTYPDLPGPLRRLNDWLQAFSDGMEDKQYLADDTPMNKSLRTSFFQRGGDMTALSSIYGSHDSTRDASQFSLRYLWIT
ncbi:hypothetical protein K3495_g13597 [Podosphaera aphanis]|nr:hypothetical protein K3495_g13597 [Podosphaera aphanis]